MLHFIHCWSYKALKKSQASKISLLLSVFRMIQFYHPHWENNHSVCYQTYGLIGPTESGLNPKFHFPIDFH